MDARVRIREHLDKLFVSAPQNRASWELQEELLADRMEKYQDLVRSGQDEESAIRDSISGIGDVGELIAALPGSTQKEPLITDEMRQRSAIIKTVAVGLYLVAGVVFFQFGQLGIAISICIIPTCLLVYNAVRHPSYTKQEDTVVEDFKEWGNERQRNKGLRFALSSLLWTLTVLIYLGISFYTQMWYITWIVFLVSACIEMIMNLIFKIRELK